MLLLVLLGSTRSEDALTARMHTHLRLAASLHAETVRGHLEVVRELAARLAHLPPGDVPPELQTRLAALSAEAGALARAGDLEAAAIGVSRLGTACGACHEAVGRGPTVRARAWPPPDDPDGAPMVRHQWAMDWLWLGLVAPSDAAWSRGARELARVAPDARLAALADRAVSLEGPAERADATAELLVTCAACHVRTGEQLQAP